MINTLIRKNNRQLTGMSAISNLEDLYKEEDEKLQKLRLGIRSVLKFILSISKTE